MSVLEIAYYPPLKYTHINVVLTLSVTIGAFSAGTFLSWTSTALPLLQADLMVS